MATRQLAYLPQGIATMVQCTARYLAVFLESVISLVFGPASHMSFRTRLRSVKGTEPNSQVCRAACTLIVWTTLQLRLEFIYVEYAA